MKSTEKVDVLVVCCWKPDKGKKFNLVLTPEGKLRATAAFYLYKQGFMRKTILSGGDTNGTAYPSEAEATLQHFLRYMLNEDERELAKESILLEEFAKNTEENITFSMPLVQKLGARSFAFLTNKACIPRLRLLMKRAGVENAQFLAAEDVLRDSGFRSGFACLSVLLYETSRRGRWLHGREFIIRTMMIFGFDRFLNWLAHKIRK